MRGISKIIAILAVIAILIWIIIAVTMLQKSEKNNVNSDYVVNNETTIVEYSSDELLGEYTNYSAKVDFSTMSISEGNGITLSGTTFTINSAGVYYFTGTSTEGNIIVNADNQEVVIVLDNVNITCSTTSVINVIDAKKVTVNVPKNTTSTLMDSANYTVFTEDDEPNATIFSKDDLTIDGKGTLKINANYEDAIASKDGLKIVGTTLEITSKDDSIRGKDYVAIKDANITINSKGKAIKATEESDTNFGYIVIDGGTFNINSEDDAIHAKNIITINNGTFTISTGDDGIHADNSIFINGGTIDITKSYEGIEANYIEINGGDISVVASDDGINVNGGTDTMGMRGQDAFKTIAENDNNNRILVINGGNISVEANGDGLDANGSIKITGGTTIVGGSTNGGNSALDYDKTFEISGGTLIAYGPTGMWMNPSSSSTQYSIAFASTGKTGDEVELKDASSNVIAKFSAKRNYGMVCISTDSLKQGEKYSLYINNEEVGTQELTSIVTSNSNSFGSFMGGGRVPMNDGEMPDFKDENFKGNIPSGDRLQKFDRGERPEMPNDGERPEGLANMSGDLMSGKRERGNKKRT